MSIIDSWYCPQCGSHNIVGGIVAECWQCSTPRPGISAVAYRTPACDKHLSRNEEHECPWCKLDQCQQERDAYSNENGLLRERLRVMLKRYDALASRSNIREALSDE